MRKVNTGSIGIPKLLKNYEDNESCYLFYGNLKDVKQCVNYVFMLLVHSNQCTSNDVYRTKYFHIDSVF